ncbi:MAG: hypothetical protein GY820_08770 [Gammaproteobacteria bacterium]|nr:hypothetical protein [Gammaproteobacteria bacterium]
MILYRKDAAGIFPAGCMVCQLYKAASFCVYSAEINYQEALMPATASAVEVRSKQRELTYDDDTHNRALLGFIILSMDLYLISV